MKYIFIDAEKGRFPVSVLCRVIGVSASGFYRWLGRRGETDRRIPPGDGKLRDVIERVHRGSRGAYGRPRILEEVRRRGFLVGGNRIRRIMRQMGLAGRSGPKRTRRRGEEQQAAPSPNVLARDFRVTAPNVVWAGDISEIRIGEQHLYLAVVVDLFSRKLVGWAIAASATAALVTGAMKQAVRVRRPPRGLLFHSDQGVQYTSSRFRDQLRVLGVRQSMSRRGNCWDNAPIESFFATLKKEMLYTRLWLTRSELERELPKYIRFYNDERLHSTLGYHAPTEYENQLSAA